MVNALKKENVSANLAGKEMTVPPDSARIIALDMVYARLKEYANVLIIGKELIAQIKTVL
jgi:hypothetical protein